MDADDKPPALEDVNGNGRSTPLQNGDVIGKPFAEPSTERRDGEPKLATGKEADETQREGGGQVNTADADNLDLKAETVFSITSEAVNQQPPESTVGTTVVKQMAEGSPLPSEKPTPPKPLEPKKKKKRPSHLAAEHVVPSNLDVPSSQPPLLPNPVDSSVEASSPNPSAGASTPSPVPTTATTVAAISPSAVHAAPSAPSALNHAQPPTQAPTLSPTAKRSTLFHRNSLLHRHQSGSLLIPHSVGLNNSQSINSNNSSKSGVGAVMGVGSGNGGSGQFEVASSANVPPNIALTHYSSGSFRMPGGGLAFSGKRGGQLPAISGGGGGGKPQNNPLLQQSQSLDNAGTQTGQLPGPSPDRKFLPSLDPLKKGKRNSLSTSTIHGRLARGLPASYLTPLPTSFTPSPNPTNLNTSNSGSPSLFSASPFLGVGAIHGTVVNPPLRHRHLKKLPLSSNYSLVAPK